MRMPNEQLEKLKQQKYVAEKKLTAAKHKEKRLQNELKRLTRFERENRCRVWIKGTGKIERLCKRLILP